MFGLLFKHITSTAIFNAKKFSASSGNNTYFTGADPNTQVAGTPDILYKDLVFCKCNGKIYTHGKFYETGDSNGDSFTEYLQTQATKANKHLILSGAEVVESNVAGYYRRTDAFVYIKDLGIVSVVPLGSDYQNLNPTFQMWRCGRNTMPEREWQYFWTNVQPSSSYPIVEKVCEWSDLARLSDLEVPVATNFQNGLVKVDSELNANSNNPIANGVIATRLSFINTVYFSDHHRNINTDILLCKIKPYNGGSFSLYFNQAYKYGDPFGFILNCVNRYTTINYNVLLPEASEFTVKAVFDGNRDICIYTNSNIDISGEGVYTVIGNIQSLTPNNDY